MAARRNLTRHNNEVALLVTTARTVGCSVLAAAALLPLRPTNKAIEQAHNRLLDAEGLPARTDPFAGLPGYR